MAPRKNPPGAPAEGEAGPSFEQALERLETIADELEGGTLSLEESLTRYEEGVRLSRRLTHTLEEAERRVERLSEEPGETPTTRPLELDFKPGDQAGPDEPSS